MQSLAQVNFSYQDIKTMSSRDIAKLIDKPHDNVLKAVRALIGQGVVKNTIPNNYVHEQNKQNYTEYLSDKRDSLVIVAWLSPECTAAVIDRWQELEAKAAQPINLNDAAFLRGLLLNYTEQVTHLTEQIAIAAPKVDYYEKVVERDHLLNASQVGQKVSMSAVIMNRHLDGFGVYNAAVKRSRVFQQWFIDKGYGELKQTDSGYPQAMFTLKGEAWIVQKFISEGLV